MRLRHRRSRRSLDFYPSALDGVLKITRSVIGRCWEVTCYFKRVSMYLRPLRIYDPVEAGRNKSKTRSTNDRILFVEHVAPLARTLGAIFDFFLSIQHVCSISVAKTVIHSHFKRSRWSKRHVQASRNGLRHFRMTAHYMFFLYFQNGTLASSEPIANAR